MKCGGKHLRSHYLPGLLVALLTWLSFALRLYHLDAQSLWYDEAISVYYIARDLPALFGYLTQDNHPPLYFLLLHLWTTLAGSSEFSLRALSVAAGVLAVPLIYVVARRVFRRRGEIAGLVAALLLAVSPWHVWYSQETRMYALATTLGLLSTYLLLRAWADNRRTWWLAYVLVASAGLYTHYYVALLLLAHAAFFLASCLVARQPRLLPRWVAGQAGIVALFLPWTSILLARAADDATYWPGTLAFAPFLLQTATTFAVGGTIAGWAAVVALAGALFLTMVGVIASLRARPEPEDGGSSERPLSLFPLSPLFLILLLIVPVLALYALVAQRPKFDPRYLLPASPTLYLAMAGGVAGLLRPRLRARRLFRLAGCAAAGLALGLWLTGAAQSLSNLYFDDEYRRDDFRGAVRYLEEQAQPTDAILVVGGHAQVLVDYYAGRGLDVYALPNWIVPNLNRPLGPPEVAAILREAATRHSRFWLLLWQDDLADPTGVVLHQIWANSHQIQLEQGFRGVDIRLFALSPNPFFDLEPPGTHPRPAVFDGQVELRGFDVDRTRVPAGREVEVRLYWRAATQLGEDLTAFLHLLDPANRVYAQIDRRPVNDFYTTSRWRPGQTVRDTYHLAVPPDTPPGPYVLEIGLYRYPSLARLPVTGSDEDRIILLPIEVTPGAGAGD